MHSVLSTSKNPVFWLVRDSGERYEHAKPAESWAAGDGSFEALWAIAESLANILEEDIRDGVPPHTEDIKLLKTLQQHLTFLQEHYSAVRKEENL